MTWGERLTSLPFQAMEAIVLGALIGWLCIWWGELW